MSKEVWNSIYDDAIESFLRVEDISEVIILGDNGGIRRILMEVES